MNAALEVFVVFLKLGLRSFGGPIAHIGYFHRELVARRRWVDDAQYAQLVAISQFLPGPASSQVGFALGLLRAGAPGALAAFVGFTLPSALLMFVFAQLMPRFDSVVGNAILHGFKLVAVAVVAHGVVTMAPRLAPDVRRWLIAGAAALLTLYAGSTLVQLAVVAAGAPLGTFLCRGDGAGSQVVLAVRYRLGASFGLLALYVILLAVAFLSDAHLPQLIAAAKAFYRSGALVFGGAHVVLPLLEEAVVNPGWIDHHEFLAGYGAAQAVPGPMFSVAAYLGARLDAVPTSIAGASVSLVAIFLPGLVLMAALLPLWQRIVAHPRALSAVAGINAAVLGILAAAWYDPVWTSSITSTSDAGIALVGFVLLAYKRTSVLFVLLWCVGASLLTVL